MKIKCGMHVLLSLSFDSARLLGGIPWDVELVYSLTACVSGMQLV